MTNIWKGLAAAIVVATTAVACGGGSSTPTTPTTTAPPTTTTPPPTTAPPVTPAPPASAPTDSATITIGANGAVSPSSVTILRGGRVTMVNNHNRNHEMASDPHPEHSECPELNNWGFLQPGQQRTSGNSNTARTCRFHDHNEPSNAALRGTVIIQ